ncbi:hypothetical protein H311_00068 [Anncaliia algerae PRA109]|nr:hypothetical protein H311_00068 [Anncaliia algerae PRA109]
MNLVKNAKFTLGVSWRCPRPCKNTISIRDKTFFNKTKVKISEILLFIYYWSQEVCNFKYISKELKWAEHTFVKFKSSLREVYAIYCIRNPILLRCPGRVVQIFESLFVRRKNNTDRMPNINWVWGN